METTESSEYQWLISLQAIIRGRNGRESFKNLTRSRICSELAAFIDLDKHGKELLTTNKIIQLGAVFVAKLQFPIDNEALCLICRHIIISMDSPKKDTNFASIFLNKSTISEGNKFVGSIISAIPRAFDAITGNRVSEVKCWQCLIHFVIVFSSANGWSLIRSAPQVQQVLNGLCTKMLQPLSEESNYVKLSKSLFTACNEYRPLISFEALNALFSLLIRPFRNGDDGLLEQLTTIVITCPASIVHLNKTNIESIISCQLFGRVLTLLRKRPDLMDNIEPKRMINLLGNIIHLGYLDEQTVKNRVVDWTWVIGISLAQCTEFAVRPGEKTTHNHWHPIFGHYRLPTDPKTEGSLRNVLRQLQFLWSSRVITCLFGKAFENIDVTKNTQSSDSVKDLGAAFNKLWKKLGGEKDSSSSIKEAPPTLAAIVCQLYITALSTMTHLKSEILSGVCRNDLLLRQLWAYLREWDSFGSSSDVPPLSAALRVLSAPSSPHAAPIQLFADAAASVISILDEEEMYEKGIPFSTQELIQIARFTNHFCFKSLWSGLITDGHSMENGLFSSIHHLCMVMYIRDSRRSFTNQVKFWLAPDVKSTVLMSEYEKKTGRGLLLMKRMSHLVLLKERMLLFRKYVSSDKTSLEGTATQITVIRNRIVEDGYRQLSLLSNKSLKSTIRVKFVNQQGLDEAGIDQDGVFKEFLELTLKKVFDPSLNLFVSTSAGVLYPSSTSSVHDDHLALFQFVGRMLAKAVYEGIVTDVQIAPVLLASVLGGRRLCAFDELSQLDAELYRNLTFVKRYEGDLSDLSLTFSIDEDFMGKVNTVDLVPGGRTIQVTNENKIDYIHRMAHHRVFTQTKNQCKAFVTGFQSVLSQSWLSLFAPHELQYLISGQNSDIDLADLKKNVQYYGGFHGSHRLIKWLWDVVENEFSAQERQLFLKFVTSCSRPPLLGFSYLEPPFSIRCVEVSDDQDQGDTLGSVVRGFLALKKSHSVTRLPTASTCFNLLKLPNYNKKSVLLAKLRYAIHSETGFELS